jgi:hypothetical protein
LIYAWESKSKQNDDQNSVNILISVNWLNYKGANLIFQLANYIKFVLICCVKIINREPAVMQLFVILNLFLGINNFIFDSTRVVFVWGKVHKNYLVGVFPMHMTLFAWIYLSNLYFYEAFNIYQQEIYFGTFDFRYYRSQRDWDKNS